MFNKHTITQFIRGHLRGSGIVSYDKRITHPIREWLLGLAIFTAVVALGSIVSANDFLQYQNLSTSGGTFKGTAVVFSQAQVQKALDAYKQKEAMYTQLQQTMSVVPHTIASSSTQVTATTTATTTATSTKASTATTTQFTTETAAASSSDTDISGPPMLAH